MKVIRIGDNYVESLKVIRFYLTLYINKSMD